MNNQIWIYKWAINLHRMNNQIWIYKWVINLPTCRRQGKSIEIGWQNRIRITNKIIYWRLQDNILKESNRRSSLFSLLKMLRFSKLCNLSSSIKKPSVRISRVSNLSSSKKLNMSHHLISLTKCLETSAGEVIAWRTNKFWSSFLREKFGLFGFVTRCNRRRYENEW